jgi:hypothetical protein
LRSKIGKGKGRQIDLLLDRQDNCINLFEIKFYNAAVPIDKSYASNLMNKRQVFMEKIGTKKNNFYDLAYHIRRKNE